VIARFAATQGKRVEKAESLMEERSEEAGKKVLPTNPGPPAPQVTPSIFFIPLLHTAPNYAYDVLDHRGEEQDNENLGWREN
jgi:hypothetical protein